MRSLKDVRMKLLTGLTAILTLSLAGCPTEEDDEPYCGDFQCQLGAGENATTCPQDCQPVCGDQSCTGDESHGSCPRDCPVLCGDGSCDGAETYQTCADDCPPPPVCGDGFCEGAETGQNCPSDCSVCTGNYPVDCQDGTGCWTAGTNCQSNVFTCNGLRRCASTADTAYCCGNAFITCPSFAPFYCPNYGLCYANGQIPPNCGELTCSFILGDC
jgi:hypothetical protein